MDLLDGRFPLGLTFPGRRIERSPMKMRVVVSSSGQLDETASHEDFRVEDTPRRQCRGCCTLTRW